MWPLDLPAHEVLKLPGESSIAWATFDSVWYFLNYPDVMEYAATDRPAELLQYYLDHGQRLGHSPNRLFDEAWHRRAYPQIAARVESGEFASAFDAYCRRGCLDRSPHWLFEELGYRDRYPDLTLEKLQASGLVNSYDHYLRFGTEEARIGHVLFDPEAYLPNFDAAESAAIRRQGIFQHYLDRVECRESEVSTSRYFDPAWYLQRYPDVASAIHAGLWKCALHHYLCNGAATEFDPLGSFSEDYYLQRDPGLREVIASRHFRNGYSHFLQFGARELRPPTPSIDLAWYAAQLRVRGDLQQGVSPNAFLHWLTIGKPAELPTAAPDTEPLIGSHPRTLVHSAATALLPMAGRFGYAFACVGEPLVSVVMPVRNGFPAVMATIASLRDNAAGNVELIIVDRGSTDETAAIGDYLRGARLLRFDTDIGWVQAANAGWKFAGGSAVLFLAPRVQLAPGAVERACARLNSDPDIGAVGGMLVQPQGVVGQAGGILWNNGGADDYQRGESPLSPAATFVRSVDFCSAAFLLVSAALLVQLDGFDPGCAASGYEAIDLCARIIQSGARVIYDPSVVLFHDDGGQRPSGADTAFLDKHATFLSERLAPDDAAQVFARHTGPHPPRLLFIEDTVPLRRLGSGFVRSNDLVRVMAELGWQVTVYPVNGCPHDPAHVFGDMPDTVEVMHDRALDGFKAFLQARVDYYDAIWVARSHNLDHVWPLFSELAPEAARRPLMILDTEAIASLREQEQARLLGRPYDLEAELRAAFLNAPVCDAVVAVSEHEAAILRARDIGPVAVIGHMIQARPTPLLFADRAGMLFLGAIHTPESPNLDSLVWFVDEVLPLIERELGWETRLTIAGYIGPTVDLARFGNHPRITLHGSVPKAARLYDRHRLFLAPTRYAAGAPYKVLEAASHGVPVVATELLRRELDWVQGEEMLSAGSDDPDGFAAEVVRLYRQELLWQTVRDGALRRIQADNAKGPFVESVRSVLDHAKS